MNVSVGWPLIPPQVEEPREGGHLSLRGFYYALVTSFGYPREMWPQIGFGVSITDLPRLFTDDKILAFLANEDRLEIERLQRRNPEQLEEALLRAAWRSGFQVFNDKVDRKDPWRDEAQSRKMIEMAFNG
jgi:hypothetical protein